jgi:16S rRNA (uracil1498-N3)-methyltransferase
MARRRFFVREIRRGTTELTGPDAEHLVRVLRAEVGQLYELSDNRDLYVARIEVARKSVVSFRILDKLASPAPTVHVSLLAALFKFDRFEWLVEKATELGVSLIQPFQATRTEPGLGQASHKRRTRWEKIALEASQQSRRVHLPRIEPAVCFAEALQTRVTVSLLLDENPDAPPILQRLPEERSLADRIALLLGPEGGWTDEERVQAVEAGWLPCSLGTTILRAETAGVAGVAIVQTAWRCTGNVG